MSIEIHMYFFDIITFPFFAGFFSGAAAGHAATAPKK
jgi:hypothetical protein